MYMIEPLKLEISQKKLGNNYLFNIKIACNSQKLESNYCYETFAEAMENAIRHIDNMIKG